jgi:PhoH-like ATPase
MIKTYILDTNVLLHNPNALFSFEDNNVVLPDVVIDELDNHKKDKGEVGANARATSRALDKIREDNKNGNLLDGYKMPNGGILRIEMNCVDTQMPTSWKDTPDLRILRVCKGLLNKAEDTSSIILVSNDSYVRIKASILGIKAEEFLTERAPSPEDLYQGRRLGYTNNENINILYSKKVLPESKIMYFSEDGKEIEMPPLKMHEYILIKGLQDEKQSALAFYNGKEIELLNQETLNHKPFDISPKNVGQKFILDALQRNAEEAPLVIIKGPAGTGKTLLALAVGLEQTIEKRQYRKILYLRGNTKLDEDIGFLPGTEEEKLDWVLRPVRDNLEVILGGLDKNEKMTPYKRAKDTDDFKYHLSSEDILKDKCDEIFERGWISVEAVAHMRGRSVAGTYVIIDEAQNLTPKQVRTLTSRASKDTKIILMGDPYQIDHPFLDFRTNGLCFAADRMAGSETTFQISLLDEECERSELSLEISKRMGDK